MSHPTHPIIKNGIDEVLSDTHLPKLNDSEILVTGGAGFLGSWLCDVMLETGANITCVDNFSTGLNVNISHLSKNENFKMLTKDVSRALDLETRFEYILNLASIASPDAYQKFPTETLLTNSLGTLNLLEKARKDDATLLLTSTSEVYGDAQIIPTPEDYWGYVNPVGVRSPYDVSKRFSEALTVAYQRQYGLDTRIVRIFNTYGPRLRADGIYGRAVSRFLSQAIQGEDLTVYGDGSQTRSFTYVTDTTRGILDILTQKQASGEIINIGNPDETSILELADMIKNLTDTPSKITFHPLPQDDPRRRRPDITKAKNILKWEPQITLLDGLQRTISWLRRTENVDYESKT